jgi:hypothetical protein
VFAHVFSLSDFRCHDLRCICHLASPVFGFKSDRTNYNFAADVFDKHCETSRNKPLALFHVANPEGSNAWGKMFDHPMLILDANLSVQA